LLRVNTIPGWREMTTVSLTGEVVFPGVYLIAPGERLSSVVARAGGLTEKAYPEGAIFTNVESRDIQLQMARQFLRDVKQKTAIRGTLTAFEAEPSSNSLEDLDGVLEREVAGRVTVDLTAALSGEINADPVLQDGDVLRVPPESYLVTVTGEVMQPGAYTIYEGDSTKDFIQIAGNETRYADKKRIYVIKANGRVLPISQSSWLAGGSRTKITAGDVIVVPVNLDYEKPLARTQSITSVVFQSMASIAAFFTIADR